MSQLLIDRGVTERFSIHPVSGSKTRHKNVLLAEPGEPNDLIADLE